MTSLLGDLQGVKLNGVLDAKALIGDVLKDPQVTKILGGDVFQSAIGSFGTVFATLKSDHPDGAALLKPLADVTGSLTAHFDFSALPLGDYANVVSKGAGMIASFISDAGQNPVAALGKLVSSGDISKALDAIQAGFTQKGTDPLSLFDDLVESIESGGPADPHEFASLVVEGLLPFGAQLPALRGNLDAVLSASASITLPRGRIAGLVIALDKVSAAAASPQQLAKAIAEVDTLRQSTIRIMTEDLAAVRNALAALRIADRLAPIAKAAATIHKGEDGVLELLHRWERMLDDARAHIDDIDFAEVRKFLDRFTTFLEEQARLQIEKPIDEAVLMAEDAVRGLFLKLGVHQFRAEITRFLASIAKAIRDANIDVVAKDIHGAIAAVDHALDPATLAAEFQQLLGDAKPVLDAVVNKIKDALKAVVAAIDFVHDTLEGILQKVVVVLTAFAGVMKTISDTIDSLDVDGATDQTIKAIHDLREAASKLLGVAPLPEPLKPMVEQVVSTLESIDFDTVFAPVEQVLSQVRVPDGVKAKITEALKEVQEKLENAIPAQLIASIDEEVKHVLDSIRSFDLNKLLDGVRKYLDEAADFLEGLKVADAAEKISGPFQEVLDAIDKVAPRKLLEPVIAAYDSLIGKISLPSASDALGNLAGTINSFGESATQKLLGPVGAATGAQTNVPSTASSSGGSTGGSSSPSSSPSSSQPSSSASPPNPPEPAPQKPPPVKPGDLIRLLGWIPAKLHEAVHALPETAAGEVLHAIDNITAGLARDLRSVRARLLDISARIEQQLDADLHLVADAQIRAQVSIRLHAAEGVDVNASVFALATVSPSEMRLALGNSLTDVQAHARDAVAALAGDAANALEQAAVALESFRLIGEVHSLDAFLAALDPEPLAAGVDALSTAVIKKIPALMKEVGDDFGAATEKIRQIFTELNPATQAQKFFRVLDVLRKELDVLNPGVLADELGAIHQAIRDDVAAYDPRVIAKDIDTTLGHIADRLRHLDLNQIIGNLDVLAPIVAAVEQANPAVVLQHVGDDLKAVGEQVAALDPAALLTKVEELIPTLEKDLRKAVEAIVAEIVALLESLKFAGGSASASVEVHA
jgi:hypothetical protein